MYAVDNVVMVFSASLDLYCGHRTTVLFGFILIKTIATDWNFKQNE